MRRRPIGQILVEKEAITQVDLAAALAEQKRSGRRLGEILIESGRISWLALARAMAEQVLDIQEADEPRPPDAPSPASTQPPAPAPAPRLEAPSPLDDPETRLQSVEAMLRERQRAFMELFSTAETLRLRVARLEDLLEERTRELSRLRVRAI
jgi:hypothetical protein